MNFDYLEEKKSNTVVIGRSSSRCANCGKNAFPDEGSHKTVRFDMKEYFFEDHGTGEEKIIPAEPGELGCGVEWKYMVSDFMHHNIESIMKEKWPQYEYIGPDMETFYGRD